MGNNIIKIISDYGVPAVVFLGALGILFSWIKYKIIPSIFKKPSGQLNDNTKLAYHVLFATINYRMNNELPTLDFIPTKPVKQQMLRDILITYLRTMFSTCKELAELDMSSWSTDRWCDEIIRRLDEHNSKFIEECKTRGVPDIVMSKFSKWYLPTQKMVYESVLISGNSTLYISNLARTNTLFSILNVVIITTIGYAEKTLKEMNGEIHGKIYNGQVIED